MWQSALQNGRMAVQMARRQPGFAAIVVATTAIGVGAATAMFTLVNAVVLRDLPFTDPDRLVWMYNLRTERDRAPLSILDLADYKRDAALIDGFAEFTNWTANLTGSGEAERLEGMRVSGAFFRLIGSNALLGRVLQPADEADSRRVAVLTYGLWTRRFGSDAALIGRTVLLNGAAYMVVGVMPDGFVFPFRDAEVAVPTALRNDPRRTDRGANFLRVIARLKPGVTVVEAKADLDAIARRLQRDFPDDDARKTGVSLYPLQSEIVGDYQTIVWMLFASVAILLAVSCGNLANLVLVRAVRRRSELALRASLGASRARIVGQLLMETGFLVILGGGIGIGLARAAVAAWRGFGPGNFPRMSEVAIDVRVLLFACAAVGASALIAGVVPAWIGSRALNPSLRSESRGYTSGRQQGSVRRAFVVLQVAAAAALMVGMHVVSRGFARLEQVDPGFNPERAQSVQLSLPPTRYSTPETIVRFYEALDERLRGLPAVESVGAVSLLPLSGLLNAIDVVFPDRPAPPPDEVPQAHFRLASAGYFEAAGIRVIAGRSFSHTDVATGQRVAVVSRTFAERHWPEASSAVGASVELPIGTPRPLLQIVGVVNDVKQFTLDREPTADLYVPLTQMPPSQATQAAARMFWVLRTRDDPRQLEMAIRSAVHAVDPDVATSSTRLLDDIVRASLSPRRWTVRLLQVFAAVSMALSIMGVYAIAAFSAGTRKRELAIRSAFGANRKTLATLVFTEEARPVLLGLLVGLASALVLSRVFSSLIFAISPTDPAALVTAALVLTLVNAAAVYVPSRRAGLIDPIELLKD